MIRAGDFRNGVTFEEDGQVLQVVEFQHVKPGKGAAFVRANSICDDSEQESVSQFFHILGAVEQQRGCVSVENEAYEITRYTSCCNLDKKIYYYTTYGNRQITAVDMHREAINGCELISYELVKEQQINYVN